MTQQAGAARGVDRVIDSIQAFEGGGFLVHRPFPTQTLSDLDPFLLLDEMGPVDLAPGEAKGAPDHPHRGFETVTYMLDGRMEHRDSQGNAGSIGPGDVQWMTAGAGIIHSEMPAEAILRNGGRMHGFQLWVNLPRRDKLSPPAYQELSVQHIPTARSADGLVQVKVIAGEALGARGAARTHTPMLYLHFQVQPGGKVEQPVPEGFNAFAYVVGGEGEFGVDNRAASRGQIVIFNGGEGLADARPARGAGPLSFLLIAGKPLREPISRYGPFVMNTRQEIMQAIDDFNHGRLGHIPAEVRRT